MPRAERRRWWLERRAKEWGGSGRGGEWLCRKPDRMERTSGSPCAHGVDDETIALWRLVQWQRIRMERAATDRAFDCAECTASKDASDSAIEACDLSEQLEDADDAVRDARCAEERERQRADAYRDELARVQGLLSDVDYDLVGAVLTEHGDGDDD